jgi:hypothetical protein
LAIHLDIDLGRYFPTSSSSSSSLALTRSSNQHQSDQTSSERTSHSTNKTERVPKKGMPVKQTKRPLSSTAIRSKTSRSLGKSTGHDRWQADLTINNLNQDSSLTHNSSSSYHHRILNPHRNPLYTSKKPDTEVCQIIQNLREIEARRKALFMPRY